MVENGSIGTQEAVLATIKMAVVIDLGSNTDRQSTGQTGFDLTATS